MDTTTYLTCLVLAMAGWPIVLRWFLVSEKAIQSPMDKDDHFSFWLFSVLFALTWPVTIPLGIVFACLYWASLAPESE